MMIDPGKELFKWGPIDARPIYIDPFVQAFVKYPDSIDGTWPDIFGFFKDDKVVFIAEYSEIRDRGEHLFKKYILDDRELKKAYEVWSRVEDRIREFEEFANKGLSDLDEEELKEKTIAWNRLYIEFWVKIFLPELGNWGGEQLLKRKILEFNRLNFIEIFEKISAPEEISFFQKEELGLMRIKLVRDEKEREQMLEEHQKKYYWLRNDYGSTRVLDTDYFRKELERISEEQARKKIKEIEDYPEKVRKEKKKIIDKYNISDEIVAVADKLAYCVWWQDYRKQHIFIANHIVTCFAREISKRKDIDFRELCYYTTPEVDNLILESGSIDAKKRYMGFVEHYKERNGLSYIEGEQADEFARPYIRKKISPGQKEVGGMVVSSGKKVRGAARILSSPKELGKMEQGDILVAPMTSPDYIVAMKKASAIITDEGGMTSHAAIVSRELGLPCIVQTRISTEWLKDGDEIEIDTEKGVVRKVE